jgi:hypothetical protein
VAQPLLFILHALTLLEILLIADSGLPERGCALFWRVRRHGPSPNLATGNSSIFNQRGATNNSRDHDFKCVTLRILNTKEAGRL